ncbi:conserved hypothetical protein [Streptococcus infantis SK1302]|uniref:Uncharacterized protein n=1 Tax=Streptococcus infantis SK1302 TaxID=871237 RepID=A0ABN0B6I2_9STRE|nr:conserved hypothetical protein [Streptococcus infantis SK1302]
MFTSIVLVFYALFFLSLSFTIYLYIRLLVAVRQGKDIPIWIYKIGHAVQGRIHVDYEEITDANALKEIHWFLLIYLIVNLLVLAGFYYHGNSFPQAIYECLKKQFFIVLVSMVLKSIGKFVVLAIRKNFHNSHAYASTNAFVGTAFLTSYVLCLHDDEWPSSSTCSSNHSRYHYHYRGDKGFRAFRPRLYLWR